MKKNLLSSIFVIGLILIGFFLLAGYQLETKVAAAADYDSHGLKTHDTMINPELRAFERYLAEPAAANKAGIVYAMDPIDLKLFNAAYASPTTVTADQARWDALGEFYTSHASPRSAEAIMADQARWDALGEFYTSHDDARSAEAITADQARWDALGEFYTSHASPRSAEAITADQARWDALG